MFSAFAGARTVQSRAGRDLDRNVARRYCGHDARNLRGSISVSRRRICRAARGLRRFGWHAPISRRRKRRCPPAASRRGAHQGRSGGSADAAFGATLVFEPRAALIPAARGGMVAAKGQTFVDKTIDPEPGRGCRRGALRQRPAAGADRRPLPARKPRACARNGIGAEGDRRPARDRARLQDLLRQGQPHQRERRARHRTGSVAADLCRNPFLARPAGADRRA